MQEIASIENLQEAFLRAAKGKGTRKAVRDFRIRLDSNIKCMREELLDGTFLFGKYHFFTIFDPKKRIICAACFPERVAFHAMMRICHPVFEAYQTENSFASRIGKGTYAALTKAKKYAGKYRWFVKLDVCKYFDSIHHDVLKRQLCRLFKDPLLLSYFSQLINGYEVDKDRGVPIGNLTSQYFANHYLAVADHYAKERIGCGAMVRYMDDVLMFSDNRHELSRQIKEYMLFLKSELQLDLHPPIINNTCHGVPFLGYIVYPYQLRLCQRSRHRFFHKMKKLTNMLEEEVISQEEYSMRAQCLMAFVKKANTSSFLKYASQKKGMYP